MGSEQEARAEIDRLLTAAGWRVQDPKAANILAAQGVAIREFELKDGHTHSPYTPAAPLRTVAATRALRRRWSRGAATADVAHENVALLDIDVAAVVQWLELAVLDLVQFKVG